MRKQIIQEQGKNHKTVGIITRTSKHEQKAWYVRCNHRAEPILCGVYEFGACLSSMLQWSPGVCAVSNWVTVNMTLWDL